MSTFFQLQAVIEFYDFKPESAYPWEVATTDGPAWIRLSAGMNTPEIGAFFARLARYNQVNPLQSRETILEEIIAKNGLAIAGGIQAIFKSQVISPSCCCGLEGWREWQDFLNTGETPWLGHDPSPWLEQVGDVVRIWSEGGSGDSMKHAFKIEVERSEFEQALKTVEQDLLGFRFSIESWCEAIGFEPGSELAKQIEQCFEISEQHLRNNLKLRRQFRR